MTTTLYPKDHQAYLDELERVRRERVNNECKNGNHTWAHHYSHASCNVCRKIIDTPTPSDYANDT